jgi:hypothetical protein
VIWKRGMPGQRWGVSRQRRGVSTEGAHFWTERGAMSGQERGAICSHLRGRLESRNYFSSFCVVGAETGSEASPFPHVRKLKILLVYSFYLSFYRSYFREVFVSVHFSSPYRIGKVKVEVLCNVDERIRNKNVGSLFDPERWLCRLSLFG